MAATSSASASFRRTARMVTGAQSALICDIWGSSLRPCENAIAAHEIVRRFFDAVDPLPHLCQRRPRQHLGYRISREVADDVFLVVVLATEDALAARRDVQMLQRA